MGTTTKTTRRHWIWKEDVRMRSPWMLLCLFCNESLALVTVLAAVVICLRWWPRKLAEYKPRKLQAATHSPHNHDDEVQQIPAVPQVSVGVEEQAVGYHLEERLHCENDEEEVLHALLQTHSGEGELISDQSQNGGTWCLFTTWTQINK